MTTNYPTTVAELVQLRELNADLLAERDQLREVNAEMLAALEAIDAAFISGDGAAMQGAIRQARAAIEKAKG